VSEDNPKPPVTIDDLAPHGAAEVPPNAVMQIWFQLFRTASIHAIDNQALQRPVEAMVEMTRALVPREGRVSLQAQDSALFVNGTKLRMSGDEWKLAGETFEFFEQRGMGGFTIEAPMDADAVRALLQALVYTPERRFDRLEAAVREANVPFRLHRPPGGQTTRPEAKRERRSYAFFTYAKLVVLYRTLVAQQSMPGAQRLFLINRIARTVQALVDICRNDESLFLALSNTRNADDYPSHHAANVALLSIAIGKKIGLSKVDLADLGVGAVFHDIGLRDCPAEVLLKPEPLDPKDRIWIEQHPLRSVEYLLHDELFSRALLSQIIVGFEHHRNFDGSGYPFGSRCPDILSRIVTIADVYDAMTAERPWRNAIVPDVALGLMLRESGKRFDPTLMKLFITMLGVYPPGTLVRLDSGDLGVVIYGGGRGERITRPIVELLGRDGRAAGTLDLSERAHGGGDRWTIVDTEDPRRLGIQASGLIATSAGIVE